MSSGRYDRPVLRRVAVALFVAIVVSGRAGAQWHGHVTPGIPRLPDGRPNLSAPLPRTADGRPDLTGLWLPLQPYRAQRERGRRARRGPVLGVGRRPCRNCNSRKGTKTTEEFLDEPK